MNRITLYTIISLILLTLVPSKPKAQTTRDSIFRELQLDSVVVSTRRPVVRTEGSKDIVQVKGSYLGKMGNLGNTLLVTPGISAMGNNLFEVVGKGVPKYYVDGREVTQQDIFKTIKSANIDRIEIERQPGAAYPAGTNAVVNIITLRPLKDRISLDVYNIATFKRKNSENPSFDFKLNKGIWTSSLSYNYGTYGNLNKETYFTEIAHPDYTFRSDESNANYFRSFSHDLTFANDIYFTPERRLSIVYNYSHQKEHENNDETISYKDNVVTLPRDVVRKQSTLSNQHTFSMSYVANTGKNSTLFLSADYSLINNDIRYKSSETDVQSETEKLVLTNNDSKYNVATFNASYNFNLPYKIATQVGARYYNTHHPLDYSTTNTMVDNNMRRNHQIMDDNVSAGFFSLSRSWGKVWLNLSGRYEYSDTRIKIKSDGETYSAARHTSDFLPTASFVWTPSQSLRLQAYYGRTMQRQGYMGLNPYPVYNDSLSYTSGNSQLTPSYTDTYSFYTMWKDFTLGFVYYHSDKEIQNVVYCPDPTINTTCEMPINMSRSDLYQIVFAYRKSFGKLFFNGMAYLSIPHFSYEYLGERHKASKASLSGNVSMSYFINSHFTAFTNFSFQSYNEKLNRVQKAANNWIVGLQSNLLNDRLSLSLTATDLLHRANYNNLDARYLNTRQGTYGTNDIRGITLSVSYSLFNQNLKVKASRNDNDVIDRTK